MKVEGHRIVVIPEEQGKESDGGIIFADVTREREQRNKMIGTFYKAGPLADLCFYADDDGEKMITAQDLKPGTRLLFVQHPGLTLPIDGEDTYWIMQDQDILGILD